MIEAEHLARGGDEIICPRLGHVLSEGRIAILHLIAVVIAWWIGASMLVVLAMLLRGEARHVDRLGCIASTALSGERCGGSSNASMLYRHTRGLQYACKKWLRRRHFCAPCRPV
jgi:hypothetical protein